MRRIVPALVVISASVVASACAAPPEQVGRESAKIDARFDPSHPAPRQVDDWSCSVHTTTWMLQATGHDVTWGEVSRRMLSTGRVSTALGLMDANGPGVAATLRDFADGAPSIGSQGYASFDEIAARAGHMAVGIGGRGWNHWTAVRGYDAKRDVILLANSAPGWKGVGQELDRGEHARLGGFAMVWMDYGQSPPPPPPPSFEKAPRPTGGPFAALHVKTPIGDGQWITQCNESGDGERVWQTTIGGPEPASRWAAPKWPQTVSASCGEPRDGVYPLVFRSATAGSLGAWVTQCSDAPGAQHVFRIDADVDGHPAAVFLYDEATADCD